MSFTQKRAHLCAVARGREMFARVEAMTPARFDILYLIYNHYLPLVSKVMGFQMEQASVRTALGLARQTVSKMVKRLVELGLITKTRNDSYDRRRNTLQLTEKGLRRVREAFAAAFTETRPLPPNVVPPDGVVPRWIRRAVMEEMARGPAPIPPPVGREVAKIYTAFARQCVHGDRRRGSRWAYIDYLDTMIESAKELARALGDTSEAIYRLDYEPDH
ncbi:MAG TPA: MarR family winged helix-turn-helix transcriptional regulator [Labilithrix sp.]|nr:MarR family winged helix-turn-helix transcriptional regulator [Labilithrix sp.]